MAIPVAILAITAISIIVDPRLGALVHSQIATGTTYQNIEHRNLCTLKSQIARRTECKSQCAMVHLWLLQALLRVSTQRSNKPNARL
jgi:hypothetical protein